MGTMEIIVDIEVSKLRLYEPNPVPEMSAEEYAIFLADVRRQGRIRDALEIMEDGLVLDGRHRFRAARESGLARVPVTFVSTEDIPPDAKNLDDLIQEYMIRKACLRRHLSPETKSALLAKLIAPQSSPSAEPPEAAKTPETAHGDTSETIAGEGKAEKQKTARKGGHPVATPPGGITLKSGRKLSQRQAAKEFGLSRTQVRNVQAAATAKGKHPDLADKPIKTAIKVAKQRDGELFPTDIKLDKEQKIWKKRLENAIALCVACSTFPCQFVRDFHEKVSTAGCGRPGAHVKEPTTSIQMVIEQYKKDAGVPTDDKGWNDKFYKIYAKPARKILDAADGDVKLAIKIAAEGAKYFKDKKLDWTLHTIAKEQHLPVIYGRAKNGKPTGQFSRVDFDFSNETE